MAGIALFLAGQVLNFSVFWRLGRTGVFYGNRLGHRVPRITGFPFSIVPHPQYTGTLVSIWGLFLIMRYPNPDWVVLPLLETVYYLAAMRLERHLDGRADAPETPQP
jgi:methylene-fatty-acyl-phospholipid synthase